MGPFGDIRSVSLQVLVSCEGLTIGLLVVRAMAPFANAKMDIHYGTRTVASVSRPFPSLALELHYRIRLERLSAGNRGSDG